MASGKKRNFRRIFATMLRIAFFVGTLIGFLAITDDIWLPAIYKMLDITQAPTASQAFVVLGGGDTRAQRAAELYPLLQPRIVIASGAGKIIDRDLLVMLVNGIPKENITVLRGSTNTYEEAVRTLGFLADNGYQSVLLITDVYHSRRTMATFACVNQWENYGLELHITGSEPDVVLRPENWWFYWWTRKQILTEWLKIPAYFFVHGVYCY